MSFFLKKKKKDQEGGESDASDGSDGRGRQKDRQRHLKDEERGSESPVPRRRGLGGGSAKVPDDREKDFSLAGEKSKKNSALHRRLSQDDNLNNDTQQRRGSQDLTQPK
eukprot:GFYU01006482.1.p3 GENE.GFYU01006482.1~~GFYU01006482.1.p3  ORF type:complete len:109 (+),score=33.41 GFYU01006482.1:170-496(+)